MEDYETMNIYAGPGSKVIVTERTVKNGGPWEVENKVKPHLKVGEIYTVERTKVHNYTTNVWLQEIPGVIFNSVNFEDYSEEIEQETLREIKYWHNEIYKDKPGENPITTHTKELKYSYMGNKFTVMISTSEKISEKEFNGMVESFLKSDATGFSQVETYKNLA
jgi:hypothetical protein